MCVGGEKLWKWRSKQRFKPQTFILYFLLLESLTSDPLMNAHLNLHIDKVYLYKECDQELRIKERGRGMGA